MRLLALVLLASGISLSDDAVAAPRVAIQPFDGSDTEPLRKQVARIVGRHGFRAVTSLAAVSGTSQYPGLAKEKRLAAFVVGEVVERKNRVNVSFLVWQGIDGSVVGRWEVIAPKQKLPGKLAKEFWKRLGPAIQRAKAPPSDYLPPAPPMRINAGTPIADRRGPS